MTDEEYIRFGLCLPKDKPFVDGVFDAFFEQETVLRKERHAFNEEIRKLRKELEDHKQAHIDQWANKREIDEVWAVIGNYNKQHLELHEAVREYIRNREWRYEDNPHCKATNPSPIVMQHARDISKLLGITFALGLKLVYLGIAHPNAMSGVLVSDLTMEKFTEEEAKLVVGAFEKWEAAQNLPKQKT
jgi:hypothetical protein